MLLEQDEHWQLEGHRMFSAKSMATIAELENLPGPAQRSRLKGATPKPEVSKDAAPCVGKGQRPCSTPGGRCNNL